MSPKADLRPKPSSGEPSPIEGWVREDLETLGFCPLCESTQRQARHSGLDDVSFGTPGSGWTIWRCDDCQSHYLDPRPSRNCIHRAYVNYYTHAENVTASSSKRPADGLFKRAASGYVHARFGSRKHRAWRLGALVVSALPPVRRKYDSDFRYLPKPSEGARLLDVGCGNGDFLVLAQGCGWSCIGIDPDVDAVNRARGRGLNAMHGNLDSLLGQSEAFDAITLHHVLEHVHNPRQILVQCLTLLKSGGQLWLETPNGHSIGHAVFGNAWRGLECPRHLILFSPGNLVQIMKDTGFTKVQIMPRKSALRPLFKESLALREGRPSSSRRPLALSEHLLLLGLEAWEALDPDRREVIALRAYRR